MAAGGLAAIAIVWALVGRNGGRFVAIPPDPPTILDPAFVSTSDVTLDGVDPSDQMLEFDQEVELAVEGSFRLANDRVLEGVHGAFYADHKGTRRLKGSGTSLDVEPQQDGSCRFSGDIRTPKRPGVWEFVVLYPSREEEHPRIYVALVTIRDEEDEDAGE